MRDKDLPPPLTLEDIARDPNKYGAPTFEQFKRNPDRWRKRHDLAMTKLTEGPADPIIRKELKRIRYFIHGVELPTEESVEKALGDFGFTLADIDLENRDSRLKKEINYIPVGGGLEHEVHVNFLP